jgi:NodT family efflux transporter outer membrane factor (OMF) lipoprotein
LGLFLAGGCRTSFRQWVANGFKVGPNYSRPSAEVAPTWIDADRPELKVRSTGSSTTLDEDRLSQILWWNLFGDPKLTQLIQMASESNLPLQIAAERVVEARAQLGIARGYLWPQQQDMKGAFTRNQFSAEAFPFGKLPLRNTFDDWLIGFEAAWELDFWGRFRRGIESAQANLEAQEAGYDEMLVILQAEVATNYIQLRTFEERLEIARQNLALQRETLEIVRARFQAGLVSALDVRQAETLVAMTESMIPLLELGKRRAENRLCTLMGMPPQDLDSLLQEGRIPEPPSEVVIGIPADLLRQRPDVRRAERLVAAQCARIGVAESDLYPHIAITGTLSWEAEKFADVFNNNALAGRVGPGFSWKILNYGRVWNNIWMEDARFRQAVLGYQETVLRAAEEAEGMIAAYLREKERLRATEDAVRATEQAVQLATALYQQGVIDYQRLIDSQRALLQQQDALAESRGNVALYLVGLYKALGGGWQVRFLPPEILQRESVLARQESLPSGAIPADFTAQGPQKDGPSHPQEPAVIPPVQPASWPPTKDRPHDSVAIPLLESESQGTS